jgi:hypothetical protein
MVHEAQNLAQNLFFIVGRAKSGTSWLMRLLNAHPEILCRGEGKFFGKNSPRSLYAALSHSEDLDGWLQATPWATKPEDVLRAAVLSLMEEKLAKAASHHLTPHKRIVGDKSPLLTPGVVGEIAAIVPEARVVHIIRDGRDVAVSSTHHRWRRSTDNAGPFELTAEEKAKRRRYHEDPVRFGPGRESIFTDDYAAKVAREWKQKVTAVIEDGKHLGAYHQLRYEDLLLHPEQELARLLQFLQADASKEAVHKCLEATSFEKAAGRKRGQEDPTSFHRKGIAGDWENVFTEEDRQAFEAVAGDLLDYLGYRAS